MTLASTTADDLRGLEGRLFDGRFRLTKLIDFGGFGAVYEAADEKIPNRRVAVKLGMAVASERAFTREAQLAGQVNHDNIVKVYDYGVEDGYPFIVMDMLHGERLDTLVKSNNGRLPRDLMIKFVSEVGSALSHAHRKHLIHRDLKPKNVILVDTGTVDDQGEPIKRFVLLDFGIAGKVDASDSLANHTMAGAGTPEYMSPEQIAGAESTAATDIYTFGVLLYQLLTGRVPFPMNGHSPGAIAMVVTSIVNDRPPPFAEAAPSVTIDPDVEALVFHCLEKDPKQRPESIREVRRRFMAAYAPHLESDTEFGDTTMTPGHLISGGGSGATGQNWRETTGIPKAATVIPMLAVLSAILLTTGAVAAWWYFRGETTGAPAALLLKGPESLDVVAGQPKTFSMSLIRPPGVKTVQLHVDSAPEGIRASIPDEVSEDLIDCAVESDLNARPVDGELVIVATAGNKTSTLHQPIRLTVPEIWLPKTTRFPVVPTGQLVDVDDRVFSEVLELRVEREVVRFRLIDPRTTTERAAPFYMQENKVWNSLYELFEKETPNSRNRKEVLGDNRFSGPSLPAFGMTANEAYEFTQWLGGTEANLPSAQQWWIAAGYFEKLKNSRYAVGPFLAKANDSSTINEILREPRPVGTSPIDVSVRGINDMGVDGSEWTSTLLLMNRPAKFPITSELDSLLLVGQPLGYERRTFEDAKAYFDSTEGFADSSAPTHRINDCGFRVVINPPPR